MKSVLSVIRSTQDSRRQRQPADVLISSIVSTASASHKETKSGLRFGRKRNLNLFCMYESILRVCAGKAAQSGMLHFRRMDGGLL